MTANEYQKEAFKFVSSIQCKPEQTDLINSALGINGEAGEFADLVKKSVFNGKPFEVEHAKKELGDIMWYIALACTALDITLEDVLTTNIDKLSARYPKGHFTVKDMLNRKEGDI